MLRGAAGHSGHCAELVELDQRLGQIEIDRAPLVALAHQDLGQFPHKLEAFHQRRVAIAQRGIAFEHQMHIRIGHALRARITPRQNSNDTGSPCRSNSIKGRHNQPVRMRIQRANIRSKARTAASGRAVGEVDAGTAQACFGIDRAARPYIMAHVGDMHLQRVSGRSGSRSTSTASSKSRAVSPSMVTIGRSRKSRRPASSAASMTPGTAAACSTHFSRKTVWQMVLADNDFDIDAEIVRRSRELQSRGRQDGSPSSP